MWHLSDWYIEIIYNYNRKWSRDHRISQVKNELQTLKCEWKIYSKSTHVQEILYLKNDHPIVLNTGQTLIRIIRSNLSSGAK